MYFCAMFVRRKKNPSGVVLGGQIGLLFYDVTTLYCRPPLAAMFFALFFRPAVSGIYF